MSHWQTISVAHSRIFRSPSASGAILARRSIESASSLIRLSAAIHTGSASGGVLIHIAIALSPLPYPVNILLKDDALTGFVNPVQ
jgi:hypothetical protein